MLKDHGTRVKWRIIHNHHFMTKSVSSSSKNISSKDQEGSPRQKTKYKTSNSVNLSFYYVLFPMTMSFYLFQS